jgi:hypothetical protein
MDLRGLAVVLFLVVGCCGFTPALRTPTRLFPPTVYRQTRCCINCLVTEDDVVAAVDKCERLWADALAAREKVDLLSTEAEQLSEASSASAEQASAAAANATTFKLSMLGDIKVATDANLDANAVLADAVDASEEAERLELLAEAATAEMDKVIEQHLIDFPDSELADE